MDLTAVRDALAQQIANLTGLRALGQARDSIAPPVAVVMPGSPLVSLADTMDGAATVNLAVMVVVPDAAEAGAVQRTLDDLLGTVTAAITSDPTLASAVDWCEPVSAGGYGRIQWGGLDVMAARVNVTVGVT